MAVFFGSIKLPDLYAFNSFLIQAHAQGTQYPRVVNPSILADDNSQHHHALIFRFARFFREFRFRGIEGARSAYSVTHVIDTGANARSAPAGANAATAATAHSATYASSIRRRHELGKRIADLRSLRHVKISNHRRLNHQLALLRG